MASLCHLPPWRGKAICTGRVDSANSGADVEPHQKQILQTQGPSGPGKNRTQALLVLRAGNDALTTNSASPVMGAGADSPCQGEMARRARGVRESEYGHEVSILSEPRGRFAFFFAMEKEGCRPQAAKLP